MLSETGIGKDTVCDDPDNGYYEDCGGDAYPAGYGAEIEADGDSGGGAC